MNKIIRLVSSLLFISVLFILLYAYAMFQGGFVSWFIFFSFLPIFLYQIILLFYPMQKWKVQRVLSHHTIRAGDSVTAVIRINRKFPFPLYYCIFEEVVPQTLKSIDNRSEKYYHLNESNKLINHRPIKKITFPWFRRTFEIQYELDRIPRGEHLLYAIRMRTGDVFGFVKKEYVYQITDELIAYPNQRQMKVNEKMKSFNQGENSAQLFHQKNTNVVSGVREYVPGDKVSWIDWKQTARNHLMMTKEFEQERNTDMLLILNGCNTENLNQLAFEGAIEVTISLLEALEKRGLNAGLLSIGKDIVYFRAKDDQLKKEGIRQHLARIQPSDKYLFSKQLLKEFMSIERQSFTSIVTTYMDTTFLETVRKMSKQTERIVVFLIQAESRISTTELEIIQQLKISGIITEVLTEKELVATPIEVNI